MFSNEDLNRITPEFENEVAAYCDSGKTVFKKISSLADISIAAALLDKFNKSENKYVQSCCIADKKFCDEVTKLEFHVNMLTLDIKAIVGPYGYQLRDMNYMDKNKT